MTDLVGGPVPAAAPAQPVLRANTLVVGSVLTLAAVIAAVGITLAFGAQRPTMDEAALRSIITGYSPATSTDTAPAVPQTPTVPPAADAPVPATQATQATQATSEAVSPPPTATPAPATPVPQSIAPTPLPMMPTPVPTAAEGTPEIRELPSGWVTVPVGPGVSFELGKPLESVHLPGITAIYVNDVHTGEVDIFTPVATASGWLLHTFDDVVNYLETDPLFSSLEPRTTNRFRDLGAVGYGGPGTQLALGFYTDPANVGNQETGWRMPGELELWIVDSPTGPVVVTAEALDGDALAFGRARDLMTRVLDYIQFGAR